MSADRSDLPSRTLLGQIRQRDPEAVSAAVRNHSRPLWKAARALGFSEHDSEDLVHDVFVTFLEKIDSFEGRSQLRTWLFGILYRKALERRRTSIREEATDPVDAIFESRFDKNGKWTRSPADLDRLMLSRELGALIEGCMEGLSVSQRAAFVLKEIEDLDAAEICRILEVSATNYGVLMYRARMRLRECLEEGLETMISCRNVSTLLLRDALKDQRWHKRLEVWIHLAMCRVCSRLAKQIRQMGGGVRQMAGKIEAGEDLEQRLLKRLAGE